MMTNTGITILGLIVIVVLLIYWRYSECRLKRLRQGIYDDD
ncbi:MAG: hypothetical protein Q7S76_02975 [bacterium]|nr:hypothetical protein [bacterium]